ncbi:MAG: cytochrome c oxidase subunit 3 [Planctomycetota bacterium]|nr:cytochrome c oxidase subunit 3 [Planctomycetota bacterium]
MNTLPEGRPVFESDRAAGAAVRMGMWLFVAGLAIIFVSTAIAHVAIRWKLGEQGSWPPDMPGPPGILGLSTILLLISSVTMWKATQRTDRARDGRGWIGVTLGLGLAYAVTQTVAWLDWSPQVAEAIEPFPEARLALTGFYVLTGLHALHAFGGLLSLGWVLTMVRPGDRHGLWPHATYWHFLDIAWVFVWLLLLLAR